MASMKSARLALATCVAAALVAACGGGGGGGDAEDSACASGALIVGTSWTVTGGTFKPSAISEVVGKVGVPLRARPTHTGVPASCEDEATYTLWEPAFPLPPGLTLNARTGEIRGTPTTATTSTGGGHGVVWVGFRGFSKVRALFSVHIEP